MGLDENRLQITTLGRFEVRRGKELISREDQRLSKRWRLFQLLLSFKGQSISPDSIYKHLALEESVNPSEALKSLVFQLRKTLKGKKSGESCDKYIICSGGSYRFNEKSDYWLDAEEFETLCKEAREKGSVSPSEAIELYRRALSLYRGNYLDEVSNAHWTIYLKKHYRELFLEAMLETNELLRKAGMYKEAWELCEGALRIVPLDEKLHTISLQSLIDSNKLGLALIQYEEASSLFKENNLNIPGELQQLGKTLKNRMDVDQVPEDPMQKLNNYNKKSGAVLSGFDAFTVMYQVEKNRSERREKSGFLVYLDLRGDAPPEMWERVGSRFQATLIESLRKGDVVCRWSPQNFLALLLNVTAEDIEKIVARLREKMPPDWEQFNLDIESRLQRI